MGYQIDELSLLDGLAIDELVMSYPCPEIWQLKKSTLSFTDFYVINFIIISSIYEYVWDTYPPRVVDRGL